MSRTTEPGARIELRNLTKRFGSFVAVDDLTFDVDPGRITGFLGPNGAGKTTTPYGMASSRQQCSSTNVYTFLSFGVVFQPRTFSAQGLSTSELLRTLSMNGCF